MAYNKVTFHIAANCDGCNGIGVHWKALNAAGIPFAVSSVMMGGVLAEAAQHQHATLIYRDVYASTVNPADYATAPEVAAAGYWARTIASLPAEVVALKGRVWLELLNEPGREDAQAQWVGALMTAMAQRALAQGWRVCGPGWAPGNPEPSAWRMPGWRNYLALCQAHPDKVAVSLHEYSLSNDIHAGENWRVGRFIHLFEACDELKIARPNVFITEAGWTLDSAPDIEQMRNDIAWMSSLYARHPQIKSVHLWTLQGGRNNGDLPGKLNSIMPWLTEWTLRQRWPDLPTPPTPPPNEEIMILDWSKWNYPVNPEKAKAAGVDAVVLRASYGTTRDERVVLFARQLREAGLPVPVLYHYFHPWQPWQPQLKTLLDVMRETGIKRAALDLEDMRFEAPLLEALGEMDVPPDQRRRLNFRAMRAEGLNPEATDEASLMLAGRLEATSAVQSQVTEAARQFMAGLDAAMPLPAGKRHLIYSNYSYWSSILGRPAWGAQYDLWVAAWTAASTPAVPLPWPRWTLWQYSSSGNGAAYGVGSARVDLNRFNGSAADLAAWLKVEDVPVDVAALIRADAATRPSAGWHPTHALPLAALGQRFYPFGEEYDITAGGKSYRYLRAMDATGKRRAYWAEVGDWGNVRATDLGA